MATNSQVAISAAKGPQSTGDQKDPTLVRQEWLTAVRRLTTEQRLCKLEGRRQNFYHEIFVKYCSQIPAFSALNNLFNCIKHHCYMWQMYLLSINKRTRGRAKIKVCSTCFGPRLSTGCCAISQQSKFTAKPKVQSVEIKLLEILLKNFIAIQANTYLTLDGIGRKERFS